MRSAEAIAELPCPIGKTGLTLSEIDYCPTSIEGAAPARHEAKSPGRGDRADGYDDDVGRYRRGKRKKSLLSRLFD